MMSVQVVFKRSQWCSYHGIYPEGHVGGEDLEEARSCARSSRQVAGQPVTLWVRSHHEVLTRVMPVDFLLSRCVARCRTYHSPRM
jgi:hypothetical protein